MTPTNNSLDRLIVDTLSSIQQQEALEHERHLADLAQSQASARQTLEASLKAALGAEVYDALAIRFEFKNALRDNPSALFDDQGARWDISAYRDYSRERFQIKAYDLQKRTREALFDQLSDSHDLRTTLLAGMGAVRGKLEARRQADAQAETERVAREAEQVKQEQEREAYQKRQAERLQAALIEQAVIESEIEAQMEAARAQEWTWPEGVEITLYRLRWCTGAVYRPEGDDDLTCDYDHGYALTDTLGADGYITVYGEYSHSAPRTIKLAPEFHKPVWERITARSAADLPMDGQRLYRHLNIAGVACEYVVERNLLVRSAGKVHPANYTVNVPPQWVIDWVDAKVKAAQS